MTNKTVHKVKKAIIRGFASGINLDTPDRFRPDHHKYGQEALSNDFANVGRDIRNSMNAMDDNNKATTS